MLTDTTATAAPAAEATPASAEAAPPKPAARKAPARKAAGKAQPAADAKPASRKTGKAASAAAGDAAARTPAAGKKAAAKPAAGKTAAGKTVAGKTPSGKTPAAGAPKAPKAKNKLVRDSFTMPAADFALIDALKERALGFRRPTKKSELLRAGLRALSALSAGQLQAALGRLEPLKIGRPKKAD